MGGGALWPPLPFRFAKEAPCPYGLHGQAIRSRRGVLCRRALIAALFQKAREAGFRRLILWTASPLRAAIHHYETLGFRKVEEVENRRWSLDGETLFEVKMAMDLC